MPAFDLGSDLPYMYINTQQPCWQSYNTYTIASYTRTPTGKPALPSCLQIKPQVIDYISQVVDLQLTRARQIFCLVAVLREARSQAAQVSQEAQQAALIIPGDCITSALFWLRFLFPTFNLNRGQQSVAHSPKLHFVTLRYIALLTVRRPHALSKCKHTSPSVALHESTAWNSWHFTPLIFLCAYLKNFLWFFDG